MNKHLIQTGRTTAQLTQAIWLCKTGRVVNYLVPTRTHARALISRMAYLTGEKIMPSTLLIEGIDLHAFDWETMRPHDSKPDVIYILDHDVVEAKYAALELQVAELTRLMQQIYIFTTGAPVRVPHYSEPDPRRNDFN